MSVENSAPFAWATGRSVRIVTPAVVPVVPNSAKTICGLSRRSSRRNRTDRLVPNEGHREKGETSWPIKTADCHKMSPARGMWIPTALIATSAGRLRPVFFGATKTMATASCSTNRRLRRNCGRQRKRCPAARSRPSARTIPRHPRRHRLQLPNLPSRLETCLFKPETRNEW